MGRFLEDALRSADLPGAMVRAKLGWGDYLRGRRDDAAFDEDCKEVDLVVRHALVIRLESQAAAGDIKAAKLLAGGLAEIRAALADCGVGPPRERRGDSRFPGRAHLGVRHPSGPCLACLGGLVVTLPGVGEVLVRHPDSAAYSIPLPAGWEDCPVFVGHQPGGELALIPDDAEAVAAYEADPGDGERRRARAEAGYREDLEAQGIAWQERGRERG